MKLQVKVSRQDLRLGLGAALIMAINLGCLNLLPAQPVTPMINLAVPQGREKDIYLPFLVKLIH